jgi:hypothetical protein
MLVMGKILKLRKVWGVVIPENKAAISVLEMIAIGQMDKLASLNHDGLVQFQYFAIHP